jgi:hypothetical protein
MPVDWQVVVRICVRDSQSLTVGLVQNRLRQIARNREVCRVRQVCWNRKMRCYSATGGIFFSKADIPNPLH